MNKLLPAILMLAALAGCASAPEAPSQLAQNLAALQQRAADLTATYNARHGLHLLVPVVRVDGVPLPYTAITECSRTAPGCSITINPHLVSYELQHGLENTIPHELAHAICISLGRCHGDDHGPEWQRIALELGLDAHDSYITILNWSSQRPL